MHLESEEKAGFVKEFKSEDQALGLYVSGSHKDMLVSYRELIAKGSQ